MTDMRLSEKLEGVLNNLAALNSESKPTDLIHAAGKAVDLLRNHAEDLRQALRDSERLDYIERWFTGVSNGERYLPLQMGWGKSRNGRTLREACDKYIQREDAAMGRREGEA